MQELNETNTLNETPVVKKTIRRAAPKVTNSKANVILNKIFDEKKVEFDVGVLEISSKLKEDLEVFSKEDLSIVIEEALKAIEVEKIAQEYRKKIEK